MIRLGGSIESVLARLGEKALELVEGIPIQWMNGTVIEDKIEGFTSGVTAVLEIISNYDEVREKGLVELIALNAAGTASALAVSAEKAVYRVFVEVNAINKVLLDGEGKSHWLQNPGREKTTHMFGRVSSAGAKVNGSTGWSVAKTGTGKYKITYTTSFSELPAFGAFSETTGTPFPFRVLSQGVGFMELICVSVTTGTVEDCPFSFMVTGI